MSSQPTSPGPLPGSSQQQNESSGPPSSSPHSTADSAVHIDENREKADADSSFQSNSSERHPKGKRKRTAYVAHPPRHLVNAVEDGLLLTKSCRCSSAKDKAILEAAYNANPKPDKAARLDIVKRVSLNEKEVQVRVSRAQLSFPRAIRAQLVVSCPAVTIADRIHAPDMVPEPAAE